MRLVRNSSYDLLVGLLTLSTMAGCAVQPTTYSGDLTPVAGTCDPPARAVLVKRGQYVQFTPREGVLILDGKIAPDGATTASLDSPGANGKPYHLSLAATLTPSGISGVYVTPRCRYRVDLKPE